MRDGFVVLSLTWIHLEVVVLEYGGPLLVDFLFIVLLPLRESVIVQCFVVRYFSSILVLQSSLWGRESWLICLVCFPGVS